VLIAFELLSHPERRTDNGGAIIAGQVDDPGFDDEAAELDEVPRALSALDLPCAHVMSRPCGLVAAAAAKACSLVLLLRRTIGYRGVLWRGGEGVSRPPIER